MLNFMFTALNIGNRNFFANGASLLCIILSGLIVSSVVIGEDNEQATVKNENLEASVSLESESLHPGDNVSINLKIENLGDGNVSLYKVPAEDYFKATCTRNGVPVPLTLFGTDYYGVSPRRKLHDAQGTVIVPSETFEMRINASRIFDMTKPGNYKFVQYLFFRKSVAGMSNRIGPEKLTIEFKLEEHKY